MSTAFGLFDVTGIELEYMIVDRDTLQVRPIADLLFEEETGSITSDVERGEVEWSNELVSHVVELKTAKPTRSIPEFLAHFKREVPHINELLARHNAMLLPTAAHPLMDPMTETVIWPHEYNEIYALYNRIFDCRGHGWSNLQSMHLNLPFASNDEFGKLHAAIRLLLPMIPAIAASSPLLDGKYEGYMDGRMKTYLTNQKELPQLGGKLIPERAFTKEAYNEMIFKPIVEAIKPFDTEGVTDKHFLNSRGAIARFDRGAIEIRVIDLQECASADLAIAELIVAVLKLLVNQEFTSTAEQQEWNEDDLLAIFMDVIKDAHKAMISNAAYLRQFGITNSVLIDAQTLWRQLFEKVSSSLSTSARSHITHILEHGCLATRIMHLVGEEPTRSRINDVYRELANCLQQDKQLE